MMKIGSTSFLENDHFRAAALGIVTCLLLFAGLNRGGLSGYDDALYAHEAREMLQSGDWHNVRFNGDLNSEYPPMFIWLLAVSMKLFGATDFAAKLPAALAGAGTLFLTFGIAYELRRDGWFATWAMVVLCTTQQFLKYATHAMTDVPFTCFVTLAIYLYLRGLRNPRFMILMGAAIGLAILTRSVLGLIPLLIVVVHGAVTREWKTLRSRYFAAGLLAALVIPSLWLWLQYDEHGIDFVRGHFAFLATKIETSQAASSFQVWPYARELMTYYWPWLPFLAVGLFLANATRTLTVIWLATVLLPLAFSSIPYGRYLMPAFPCMAVVAAVAVDRWIPEQRRRSLFVGVLAVLLTLTVFTVIFPPTERATEIRVVATAAQDNSEERDRLLLFTFGERRYDLQNQLLWYSDRFTQHIVDIGELRAAHSPGRVGVIDKGSFSMLADQPRLEVVAESELLYCYVVR